MFLKEFFEKVDFEKNQQTTKNYPEGKALDIKTFVLLDKLMAYSILFISQFSCLIFSNWILRLCRSRSDGLHHFAKGYIWVQLNKVKQLEDISHISLWIHCNDGFSSDVTSAGQGLILGASSHYF